MLPLANCLKLNKRLIKGVQSFRNNDSAVKRSFNKKAPDHLKIVQDSKV